MSSLAICSLVMHFLLVIHSFLGIELNKKLLVFCFPMMNFIGIHNLEIVLNIFCFLVIRSPKMSFFKRFGLHLLHSLAIGSLTIWSLER